MQVPGRGVKHYPPGVRAAETSTHLHESASSRKACSTSRSYMSAPLQRCTTPNLHSWLVTCTLHWECQRQRRAYTLGPPPPRTMPQPQIWLVQSELHGGSSVAKARRMQVQVQVPVQVPGPFPATTSTAFSSVSFSAATTAALHRLTVVAGGMAALLCVQCVASIASRICSHAHLTPLRGPKWIRKLVAAKQSSIQKCRIGWSQLS